MSKKWVFKPYLTPTYQTPLIYIYFILFTGVKERNPEFKKPLDLRIYLFKRGEMVQSYPPRALDRRLQED